MTDSKYRPDVDGLRAFALSAVVVFHLFPEALPGGFVGVDVFFVISGFLITGLLCPRRGSLLDLRDFYARRIRRLFPSLLLVVALCLGFGQRVLLPNEFEQLGRHATASFAYVLNFILVEESGYFDALRQTKVLQPLWSLAVEEQFYLVWPLLVWGALRLHRRGVLVLVLTVMAGSFAVNLWLTLEDPTAGFYWPFGRGWEFALGGALAVWTPNVGPRRRQLASVVGLGLLGLSVALVDAHGFPGVAALLPTLGAALVILGGPETPVGRGFGARAFVALGLISYPVYLWHWPLLVFARILGGEEPLPGPKVVLGIASVLLGAASYWWLERPLRRASGRVTVLLGAAAALIALTSAASWHGKLKPQSAALGVDFITAASKDWKYPPARFQRVPGTSEVVYRVGQGEPTVLFVGDSNMQQYAPRLDERARQGPAQTFEFATVAGCPLFARLDLQNCAGSFDLMRARTLQPSLHTIVISSQWAYYFENAAFRSSHVLSHQDTSLDALFARFGDWLIELRKTKRVVIISSIPSDFALAPKHMLHRQIPELFAHGLQVKTDPVSRAALVARLEPFVGRLRREAQRSGAEFIDPFELLCDATWCPSVNAAGVPLYVDEYHLRPFVVTERFIALDTLIRHDL